MTSRYLVDAPTSAHVTIRDCEGESRYRQRLMELGVRPGARVSVLQRTAGGGLVLGINGARIALDRSMTRRIEIDEEA